METATDNSESILDELVYDGRRLEGRESRQEELAREATKADREATIQRLSALRDSDPLEYDHQRRREAGRLHVRTAALDRAVAADGAGKNSKPLAGSALEFPEPEPWPEPVHGAQLLDELCAAFNLYLVLPDGAAEAIALWAVFSYCYDSFQFSPRLAFISPTKRCGKTTALGILSELASRALPASNVTSAAVFRVIESARPTLIIDEADTFLPENEALRGVLNSGHSRPVAFVLRTVGDDFEPRKFSTWAPIVIAQIGKLPDTLADRSIGISMRRKTGNERVQSFSDDAREVLRQLKRKIVRWLADNGNARTDSRPTMPAGFVNRLADNWRPLFAIADAAGGHWPALARSAAMRLAGTDNQEEDDIKVRLLADIRTVLGGLSTGAIGSTELCEKLAELETAPWSAFSRGRPLGPAKLARMLGSFGVYGRNLRHQRGYSTEDFQDAFARYLPSTQDQSVEVSQTQRREGETPLSEVSHVLGCDTLKNEENPSLRRTSDTLTLSNPLTETLAQKEGVLV